MGTLQILIAKQSARDHRVGRDNSKATQLAAKGCTASNPCTSNHLKSHRDTRRSQSDTLPSVSIRSFLNSPPRAQATFRTDVHRYQCGPRPHQDLRAARSDSPPTPRQQANLLAVDRDPRRTATAGSKWASPRQRRAAAQCQRQEIRLGGKQLREVSGKIVAEIDQLFRMLGLSTSVTVMNGNTSAVKNAAKFLSKLQNIHTDVKLTHDQVQSALLGLAEKRKSDEIEQELVAQKPVLRRSHSPAADNLSVSLLMGSLGSGETASKDKTLLALIRTCVTSNSRVQVYKADGIQLFAGLVQGDESYFTQLYALHCLSWFTFIYSKMPEMEFETLRGCIPEAAPLQIQSLICDLKFGTDQEKEDAAIRCSCMATRGDVDILRTVGVLAPLVHILEHGTPNQKLWTAEALGTLASNNDENCVAIAREKAIQPVIALLRSGTDMQKQEAAYALGNLAANNDVNRATIAREGAIPPMVAFVKAVTDAQNQWAVYALGTLSLSNEANRVAIAQEGAITPLIQLLRVGASAQKQWAAYTIGNLAYNDANRAEITLEGAVKPLVALLEIGTDAQKQWAAYALGNLACDNEAAMELDEGILPLVELVRTGSDPQKQEAAYTLGNLAASDDGNSDEIGREGAIAPLVGLLHAGTSEQKQWAAYALACLAENNEANRAVIVKEGAVPPLLTLVLGGTEVQQAQAVRALGNLAEDHFSFPSEKVVVSLVGFLRVGTSLQKSNAVLVLKKLASVSDGNRDLITLLRPANIVTSEEAILFGESDE
ncbi:hypothetical protein ON010_g2430 [Phytophthora cinnamomi]|nr:hypothetical protein ON010_g2430 [Phytophthora cinnamomi]